MNLIDWILDLAALLLWVDWRSGRAMANRSAKASISIANSVRPTEKSSLRGWGSLGALLLLLLIRPFFYSTLGSSTSSVMRINLIAISIPWRIDLPPRMMAYSLASFGCALGIFYSWLLLLSVVNRKLGDEDVVQRFVRLQLGWVAKIPAPLKILLPLILAGLCWMAVSPLLFYWKMIPAPKSAAHLWEQAGLFTFAALLLWRWLLLLSFTIHFVNLYVYLGTHPFWNYMSHTARVLLVPLKWLRFGGLDLSPLAGIAAVLLLSEKVIIPMVVETFGRLPW
jgi:hypothetical protein